MIQRTSLGVVRQSSLALFRSGTLTTSISSFVSKGRGVGWLGRCFVTLTSRVPAKGISRGCVRVAKSDSRWEMSTKCASGSYHYVQAACSALFFVLISLQELGVEILDNDLRPSTPGMREASDLLMARRWVHPDRGGVDNPSTRLLANLGCWM